MTIVPIAHGLTLAAPAPGYVRTPGLHMSDLYNSLFEALEPGRYQQSAEGPPPLKMEAGLALEEGLEASLKARFKSDRPGEFTTREGIIFSPDFLVFNGLTRLAEIKLTWMSCRELPRVKASTFPPKFDKWICQMKCYCYHLDTCEARLLGFFVNGDYRKTGPGGPEMLGWDFTFTARELKENWTMVCNHARHVGLLS